MGTGSLGAVAVAGGAFVLALVVTAILTAGLRRVLLRLGWVDTPRADRWHRTPVPRPGGPAIVAVILVGFTVLMPRPWSPQIWGVLAGGMFVFLVGLTDDIVDLPNPLKLTLLIVGATIPIPFGISFVGVPAPFGSLLAMLWILVITNAVNWLDNMDGLAAGVSAIAAGTLAILSMAFADRVGSVAATLVAGANVGFLFFNFSPARIFMGDSGSSFLGFTLATLTLLGSAQYVSNVLLTLIVPLMVLSIPIFDSAVVTLTRAFHGRRLFQGGKDHPSHRLVVMGLSERQAVLYLYGLSAISAAAALVTSQLGLWTGLVLTGMLACTFVALGIGLTRIQVYEEPMPPNGTAMVVLSKLSHIRRLFEITVDLVLIPVAYLTAYLLRYEGTIPPGSIERVGQSLPIVVGVKMVFLYIAGSYKGDWRYVGLLDLVTLARATAIGSAAIVAGLFIWTGLGGYSRAVFVIDWVLTFGLLAGMRVSVRLIREYLASQSVQGKRVLIFGAGQGGVLLLQEIRSNPSVSYRPIGFVDDDPVKRGTVIRGLPVLGGRHAIPALVAQHGIEEVILSAPSLTTQEIDRIALICRESGVPCRQTRSVLEPMRE